ncbi:hypothetical protein E2C01_005436 [Portunus trituberculatus]|uniref:Uncharacterized protein n=1 Tax=Portunus trituberculatus TaxID=210409 RepID=A0A5B7CV55_PORTR|nr:hypothetical protein [Portunus trituberculatus]
MVCGLRGECRDPMGGVACWAQRGAPAAVHLAHFLARGAVRGARSAGEGSVTVNTSLQTASHDM